MVRLSVVEAFISEFLNRTLFQCCEQPKSGETKDAAWVTSGQTGFPVIPCN
jgi:hypothetical protein